MKTAIIAVGYNRKDSYKRLVESLQRADYGTHKTDLILSMDHSDTTDVYDYAREVSWSHGEKIVRYFKTRQGLRSHILQCGDYLDQGYDAVFILEDDLIVSPAFFQYGIACIEKYQDCDDIAGISLYSHLLNVHCMYPFIPHSSPYDVFFFQIAQSWGQIWMKKQWKAFTDWYKDHSEGFPMTPQIPDNLASWGKNSWLKYHIRYGIETGKFFVYPYLSLTTCFSEAGTHFDDQDDYLQVPMLLSLPGSFRLPDVGAEDAVCYDAFFERYGALHRSLALPQEDLTVDLYGLKAAQDKSTRYLLTDRVCSYPMIRSFGRALRPHEDNIILDIPGNDFFLYDLNAESQPDSAKAAKPYSSSQRSIRKFVYYFRIRAHTSELFRTTVYLVRSLTAQKLRRLLRR